MNRLRALGTVVSLVVMATTPLTGQNIEQAVRGVRDGLVRMSFAAREGVCGDGRNQFSMRGDEHWLPDCDNGPVMVQMERRAGATVDIDTYVGGRWTNATNATDLGLVSAPIAARYFLNLARSESNAAEDAIFPATLADSFEVWPELSQIARDRSIEDDVRNRALFWVGQLGDESAVDFLIDFVQSESDQELRERAVFALSQHPSDRSVNALRDIAADQNEDLAIRERAIFWLGQQDGDHGYLRELYARIATIDLKEKIIFSVSQGATDGDWNWLLSLATSSNEPTDLREKALFWAGQSDHDIRPLVDLYDRMQSHELKERLLFVYSQRRGDEQALDKLMDVARTDENRELRRKAIFWLGQTNDPRAIDFLAELIG